MQVLILLQNMEILHPQLQLVRRPERRRRNIPLIRNDDGLEQKRVTNHERRRWRRVEAVKDELELCLHLRHDNFEDVVEGVRGSTKVRDQGERYVVMFCFGGS